MTKLCMMDTLPITLPYVIETEHDINIALFIKEKFKFSSPHFSLKAIFHTKLKNRAICTEKAINKVFIHIALQAFLFNIECNSPNPINAITLISLNRP